MSGENETLVRGAYEPYGRDQLAWALSRQADLGEARRFTSEGGPG
jgi:hypothetical protein